MSSIFPLRETVTLDDERGPRLVDLDEETADEVFEALASRTTREIFLELHSEPQTASDLASATDTSVQNAQYHLDKLTDADLVEIVDTWYSDRGAEMNVYAPTDESLVLFAGEDKERSFKALLKRVLPVITLLVPVSALVAWLSTRGSEPATKTTDGPGIAVETAEDTASEATDLIFGLAPALALGLAFFLGGLFAIMVGASVWYARG